PPLRRTARHPGVPPLALPIRALRHPMLRSSAARGLVSSGLPFRERAILGLRIRSPQGHNPPRHRQIRLGLPTKILRLRPTHPIPQTLNHPGIPLVNQLRRIPREPPRELPQEVPLGVPSRNSFRPQRMGPCSPPRNRRPPLRNRPLPQRTRGILFR